MRRGETRINPVSKTQFPPLKNRGANRTRLLGLLCPHKGKMESFVTITLLLLFWDGPPQKLGHWFSWPSAV